MLAERNTVRQARLCVGGDLRHRPDRGFLFDQPLGLSVARYIYDPSRVGYPQGVVRRRQHAFRMSQIRAAARNSLGINLPALERIGKVRVHDPFLLEAARMADRKSVV